MLEFLWLKIEKTCNFIFVSLKTLVIIDRVWPLPLLYWIYENHFHRLTSWNNRPFLSPANLQLYAQAVSRKGSIQIGRAY